MTPRAALLIITLLDAAALWIMLPLVPLRVGVTGGGAAMVALLFSVVALAQLVTAPLWGRLSDRYGRHRIVILGLLLAAAGHALFALSETAASAVLARLVVGSGTGTAAAIQAALAEGSASVHRARTLGWHTAAASLGGAIGPALAVPVVAVADVQYAPIAGTLLCLLAVAVALPVAIPRRRATPEWSRLPSERSLTAAIGRVARRPGEPLSRLLVLHMVGIGAAYGAVTLLPVHLARQYDTGLREMSYWIMYLGAIGFLVRAGGIGTIVRRLDESRVMFLGLVAIATGLLLLTVPARGWGLLAPLTVLPIGMALAFPCLSTLLTRHAAPGDRAMYLGLQHSFGGLARLVFPIAGGLAIDSGMEQVPLPIAALLLLASLWWARPLAREQLSITPLPQPIPRSAEGS